MAAKLSEMKQSISRKVESTVREVSSSVKDVLQGNQEYKYLPQEMVHLRESYVVPLARAVGAVGQHFLGFSPQATQSQVGDDLINPSLGWLVRREFCSAFFTLLLHGFKRDSIMTRFIVGRATKLTLWSLIKEVCQACVEEPVLQEIVNVIQKSPFLFDDDLRARNFVCEALNWQNEAFTEKLLITWFRNFTRLGHIIDKYFQKDSIWKRPGHELRPIVAETVNILGQLNGNRFNLHADFEHRELAKRIEEQHMAFILQREPKDVDINVMSLE